MTSPSKLSARPRTPSPLSERRPAGPGEAPASGEAKAEQQQGKNALSPSRTRSWLPVEGTPGLPGLAQQSPVRAALNALTAPRANADCAASMYPAAPGRLQMMSRLTEDKRGSTLTLSLRRFEEPAWFLRPTYMSACTAVRQTADGNGISVMLQRTDRHLQRGETQLYFGIAAGKAGTRSAESPGAWLRREQSLTAAQLIFGRQGASALFWHGNTLSALHATKEDGAWRFTTLDRELDQTEQDWVLVRPGQRPLGLSGRDDSVTLYV